MINWQTFLESVPSVHSKRFAKNGGAIGLPSGSVPVFLFDMAREGAQELIYVDCDLYLAECNRALVPLDMQILIKKEYEKGNLLIINVVNYLKDYFLLVRIIEDKFTFISSPGDNS